MYILIHCFNNTAKDICFLGVVLAFPSRLLERADCYFDSRRTI